MHRNYRTTLRHGEASARYPLPGKYGRQYTGTTKGYGSFTALDPTPFPITHEHGKDARAAERHCFALATGGWIAKLKHVPAVGWQVIVTGFRGVQHARTVR